MLATGLPSSSALAHSPFLLPNYFDVSQRDHVTVQASFSETPFIPDVVMKSDDFHVDTPDGRRLPLAATHLRDFAVLEAETPAAGTYRLSSGQREGRRSKAFQRDGKWVFVGRDEADAKGQQVYEMRSITCAEVYVTRGAPSSQVLAARGKGLEFRMITHPNKLLVGDSAELQVLFDGRPLPAQPLSLSHAGDATDAGSEVRSFTSDADGRIRLALESPGLYHLMARYRHVLPGKDPVAESHTYALTLEVTD
jgi:uncharacterized GH25 family protein